MVVANGVRLDEIIALSQEMLNGTYGAEELKLLEVVHNNAVELRGNNLDDLNMVGLSAHSHDLRQPLATIVGYSALLNSPKLANHNRLSEEQIKDIYRLHDLCRHFHWNIDNLILFSNYVMRQKPGRQLDRGMLDIRGYLLAQTENYVCRKHITDVVVPEKIPFVYANDASTKLMIRGLFAAALDINENPELRVSAYTVMRVVRARIYADDAAEHYDEIMKMLTVKEIPKGPDSAATLAMVTSINRVQMTSMLRLGLYVATNITQEQGGRIKLEKDMDNLVFTLTMPTLAKTTSHV